ncbi:MAG TPA: helix-turn-helix domain-containing protein [Smithellaceae bacterium]|nr:helix-turn-helix domain-containing protein [Smithellaceae bacterium]
MKVNEVPQDITFYEGVKRACYALNEEGKYVVVPSTGWDAEDVVNSLAVDDLAVMLEETRNAVWAGLKSPLCYHMERRQMNPDILAKTAGIAVFRVKRHFRPEIFVKLNSSVLNRYAQALAVTVEELLTVPQSQGR